MCVNDGNWYRNRLRKTPQLACFAVEDGIVAVLDPVADVDVGGVAEGTDDGGMAVTEKEVVVGLHAGIEFLLLHLFAIEVYAFALIAQVACVGS